MRFDGIAVKMFSSFGLLYLNGDKMSGNKRLNEALRELTNQKRFKKCHDRSFHVKDDTKRNSAS